VRLEQLYPFPEEQLRGVLKKYKKAKSFVWLQEEPRNRGAWTFLLDRMSSVIGDAPFRYVGRPASASPATGSHHQHEKQVEEIFAEIVPQAVAQEAHR
jgi:2-oxoglutarate dehydrogenase E1 component